MKRLKYYYRRSVQFLSLVLLNFSWGPEAKWFCAPVLNCHACPLAWFACPIGVLAQFSGYHVFPFLALGTVVIVGVLFGRLLCGWVCPFGLIQDLLFKIPSPKFSMPRWTGYIKYVILLLMVFLLPYIFGGLSKTVFCWSCPMAGLTVTVPKIVGAGFSGFTTTRVVKLGITSAVLVLAVFSSRSFCKVFCPLGALLAPLNLITFWKVKMPEESCRSCRLCDVECTMELNPSGHVTQGIPVNRQLECVGCYDCQFVCPKIGPDTANESKNQRIEHS